MAICYNNIEFEGFREYIKTPRPSLYSSNGTPLFAHPIDGWILSALNTLRVKHSLDTYVDTLVSYQFENVIAQGVFIDHDSFPEQFTTLSHCARTLQIPMPHAIASHDSALFNAYTAGTDNYAFIVISTALLHYFSKDEAGFVIGHECGHIASSHMMYHTLVSIFLGRAIGGIFGQIASAGLTFALTSWSRRSEITADRAGLLCCGDLKTAERALLRLVTGFADVSHVEIEDYLEQSRNTRKHHGVLGRMGELLHSHPLIPRRIEALRLFAQSETYYAISGKEMPFGVSLLTKEELDKRVEQLIKLVDL